MIIMCRYSFKQYYSRHRKNKVHIKFWIEDLWKRPLGKNRQQKYVECMSAGTGQAHCESVDSQKKFS
jgi:hypothetical protein